MTAEANAYDALEVLEDFRNEHPFRTASWGVLGVIGVNREGGQFEQAVGVANTKCSFLAPLRMRRMGLVLGEAGLGDVTIHEVNFHPTYLNPNY